MEENLATIIAQINGGNWQCTDEHLALICRSLFLESEQTEAIHWYTALFSALTH
jgi:hypothetical protein